MGMRWDYQAPVESLEKLVENNWDAALFVRFRGDMEDLQVRLGQKVHTLQRWEFTNSGELAKLIEEGIFVAIAGNAQVMVLALPQIDPTVLTEALGMVARNSFWMNFVGHDPMKNLAVIRFYCPNEEMFDAVNRYFQGPWELPGLGSAAK